MTVTLLSQYDRKARKEHKCTGCNCVIEKGWSYQVLNLVEDRKVYTWKSCEKCEYCLIVPAVFLWMVINVSIN